MREVLSVNVDFLYAVQYYAILKIFPVSENSKSSFNDYLMSFTLKNFALFCSKELSVFAEVKHDRTFSHGGKLVFFRTNNISFNIIGHNIEIPGGFHFVDDEGAQVFNFSIRQFAVHIVGLELIESFCDV